MSLSGCNRAGPRRDRVTEGRRRARPSALFWAPLPPCCSAPPLEGGQGSAPSRRGHGRKDERGAVPSFTSTLSRNLSSPAPRCFPNQFFCSGWTNRSLPPPLPPTALHFFTSNPLHYRFLLPDLCPALTYLPPRRAFSRAEELHLCPVLPGSALYYSTLLFVLPLFSAVEPLVYTPPVTLGVNGGFMQSAFLSRAELSSAECMMGRLQEWPSVRKVLGWSSLRSWFSILILSPNIIIIGGGEQSWARWNAWWEGSRNDHRSERCWVGRHCALGFQSLSWVQILLLLVVVSRAELGGMHDGKAPGMTIGQKGAGLVVTVQILLLLVVVDTFTHNVFYLCTYYVLGALQEYICSSWVFPTVREWLLCSLPHAQSLFTALSLPPKSSLSRWLFLLCFLILNWRNIPILFQADTAFSRPLLRLRPCAVALSCPSVSRGPAAPLQQAEALCTPSLQRSWTWLQSPLSSASLKGSPSWGATDLCDSSRIPLSLTHSLSHTLLLLFLF